MSLNSDHRSSISATYSVLDDILIENLFKRFRAFYDMLEWLNRHKWNGSYDDVGASARRASVNPKCDEQLR